MANGQTSKTRVCKTQLRDNMRKVFVLFLVGLIGVLLFSSISIAAAGLEIGDLVYRESPSGGWKTGHVGIFIGYYDGDANPMVVDAVPPEDTPVRKITLTQFKTEGGPYRGGKTYKSPTLTTQQRENICEFAIGKVNNWKYCDVILHINQKGEDGEHCDCVGLGEAAYESIGLDPVPDEGLWLLPEEQFISSKMKTSECVTDDDCEGGHKCCTSGANAGTCYTPGTPQEGCCDLPDPEGCMSGTMDPAWCTECLGGTWHQGQTCCTSGANAGTCYTPGTPQEGCCDLPDPEGCMSGTMDPAWCTECLGGTWHQGQTCCTSGANAGTCYTPGTPQEGCCDLPDPEGCMSGGTMDPAWCTECLGGTWDSEGKCCGDGNCHECCDDDDCPEGEECVDYTCQEVPEFPAGVTAVFGATFFIFLMMRRKYVRK